MPPRAAGLAARPDRHLLLIGLGSAMLYLLLFLVPFPLPGAELVVEREDDTLVRFLRAGGPALVALYTTGVGLLFAGYVTAWRATTGPNGPRLARLTFGFALLFSLILLLAQPVMSSDIFAYALRARMIETHGLNPLVTPPSALVGDPWLPYAASSRDLPTPYGPLWLLATAPVARVAGDSLVVAIAGLKVVAWLAYLLDTALIGLILRRVAPARATSGMLLFAWNPLVALELVGNGHNDGLMLAATLLAILALVHGRWRLAPVALAAAMLVKLSAALVAPLLIAVMARRLLAERRVEPMVTGAGLALALMTALYGLFWAGPATLAHVTRVVGAGVINSPVGLLVVLNDWLGGSEAIGHLVRLGANTLGALLGLRLIVHVWRWPARLFEAQFDAVFIYLALAAAWFFPWYVSWLMPAAALLADRRRQVVAVVFSATVLTLYLNQVIFPSWPLDWAVAVPLMFGPPVLLYWRLVACRPPNASADRAATVFNGDDALLRDRAR